MTTTTAHPPAAIAARPARAAARAATGRGGWLLPALLVGGCLVAALAAADAELARLLRAMAAIKGVMLVAGVGALAWRLGRPTPAALAAAYLAGAYPGGAWVASGAVAAMWSLVSLGAVAVALHGTAAVALLAWRDAGFVPAPGGARRAGGARA